MSKEVVLMADVQGLGSQGEVVRVAEGYARNFLLPRNLAAPVTEATRRKLAKVRKVREEQDVKELETSQNLVKSIEQVSCTIPVKTGEGGKLFGSVTATDIVSALKAQGIEIDKHQVDLPDPLRELGVFNIPIKVHPKVQATLKIWVVEE
jgi:large subunit ribosomal protein L9